VTDARRDHWARVVAERAATYWTPARTDDLLRGKAVAIRPAEGAVVLRALGILDGDGQLPPQRVGKYFQVNHMIGTLAPTLPTCARATRGWRWSTPAAGARTCRPRWRGAARRSGTTRSRSWGSTATRR
jgi:hypothetical protein